MAFQLLTSAWSMWIAWTNQSWIFLDGSVSFQGRDDRHLIASLLPIDGSVINFLARGFYIGVCECRFQQQFSNVVLQLSVEGKGSGRCLTQAKLRTVMRRSRLSVRDLNILAFTLVRLCWWSQPALILNMRVILMRQMHKRKNLDLFSYWSCFLVWLFLLLIYRGNLRFYR